MDPRKASRLILFDIIRAANREGMVYLMRGLDCIYN